jgi:hypothetical protein
MMGNELKHYVSGWYRARKLSLPVLVAFLVSISPTPFIGADKEADVPGDCRKAEKRVGLFQIKYIWRWERYCGTSRPSIMVR